MSTIGSIGAGLFILIIIWLISLITFVFAVRTTQSNLGWLAIGVACVITAILVLIPTEKQDKNPEDIHNLVKDYSHFYRKLLLLFLALSVIVGFIAVFVLHCIEPVRPKPIKSFYVKDKSY